MRNSFLCLFVFAVANMGAQNNMADILASIETNNPELKAGAQIVLSQKAEVSSQNTLEPTMPKTASTIFRFPSRSIFLRYMFSGIK